MKPRLRHTETRPGIYDSPVILTLSPGHYKLDQIFIQIASYRDTELPLTIESAINNAEHPDRLTFGICWQYDEQTYTDLDIYLNDSRFRINQTYYEHSKGCCWARNQTNLLYEGEKYTLQIDAHTRFAEHWDSRFIKMLQGVESNKPLLSTYPAPFEYIDGEEHRNTDRGMQQMALKRMFRNLTTKCETKKVEDSSIPVPGKFIGAGQIFTLGQFCREVEYDPELYFEGEEISLAARAYTQGYDFFCPNEDLLWHLYQHPMPLHWGDHRDTQQHRAIERLHTLLIGEHTLLGKHGLGKQRSLAEFEAYAQINFQASIDRKPIKTYFKRIIELDYSGIRKRNDYDYWIFTLRNIQDEEIYRQDLFDTNLLSMQTNLLEIDTQLKDEPISYMLWLHTRKNGYLAQHFHEL